MNEFFDDYQSQLAVELVRIQKNLQELKSLIDEDKKLLEKIRRKRGMKAEQKKELYEEREIIERMNGYTLKITELASQKNLIKQDIIQKHQKEILLELMEVDRREQEISEKDKKKEDEARAQIIHEIQEKRDRVHDLRKKKMQRTFSPIKTPEKMYGGKSKGSSPSMSPGKKTGATIQPFNKKSIKEELLKQVEAKRRTVKKTINHIDPENAKMTNKHSHYMYNKALQNHYDMEQARFEMKIERNKIEMEEATFRPKINEKSRQMVQDSNIGTFKVRAFCDIEKGRQDAIIKRSRSYLRPSEVPKSSQEEFKMGKEYHGHMYTKTMKWELDRKDNLEQIRLARPDLDINELRDRPGVLNKESIRLLEKNKNDENHPFHGHEEDRHEKLYNDRKRLKKSKDTLTKHYNKLNSPFKPTLNHPQHTPDPSQKTSARMKRSNSDEILKGLLTDMAAVPGTESKNHYQRLQIVEVPKEQKKILADMLVPDRHTEALRAE